ncbi:MAG: flavodoxin [Oscillospiraceae bacterium]|nr:flavodoxin [Oscillospiraceae bacterium]
MKKISAFIISAAMLFSLTACGNSSSDGSGGSISNIYSNGAGQSSSSTSSVSSSTESSDTLNSTDSEQTSSNVPESSLTSSDETTSSVSKESSVSSTDNSAVEEKPTESTDSQTQAAPEQATSTTTEENTPSEPEGTKILVAFFSATNTTKGVAQKIANAVNADLYEITPQQPYTSDDLNYHNDSSRTSIEMNDPNARPAISGSVTDMEQYDIVFVGYPIWWGDAPRIMSTFVESYSFSDKTVVPFCTSASSGVGSSASNLERQAGSGNWLSGTRLNGSASDSDISSWINGLGLNL